MKNELEKRLKEAELVIFDLDGTLVDSNGSSNEIDVKLVRMLGEKKSDNEIIEERDAFFKTTGFEGDIYEKYCKYLKDKYKSNLSAEEIRNIRRKMLREASKNIKFKPNADELIKYLKNQNKKLGLATVSRQETIDKYSDKNREKINGLSDYQVKDFKELIDLLKNI